jgi:predicted GIY-YIG superfamily endonuclease
MHLVLSEIPWKHSVYVIGSGGGPVKIGYARNVNKRLQSLQIGSHEQLYVLETIDRLTHKEALAIERAVHKELADKRVRGEWFDVSLDEAMKAIHSKLDLKVSSARMLSTFDLRGHVEPQDWYKIAERAEKEIINGCSI